MYSVDMKNIVPKESLTYLVTKATLDESMLWHRRLGHVNFKTINKLVKENLVRGLPIKHFENDQTCVACLKGKQHKASCKSKIQNSITQPLFMLHMDLFGPTFVSSLMNKKYCLVVTDDYSRFTWVFFLASKDETSGILKSFITEIENLVDKKVKIIRCDNGTEFKNRVMSEFCEKKGIKKEFSVARTPQQNGVAERRNRTLIEAARTILVMFDGHSSNEIGSSQDYILMRLWKDGSLFDSSSKNASNGEPQPSSDAGKKDDEGDNATHEATHEATHADFFGDETKVDMSNITTTYSVPSTPNIRIHKDYSLDHVIGDVQSGVQTRRMIKTTNEQGSKLDMKHYRNEKDKRGIVVRNKARLVVQGYTQEEGIDYDEVFTPITRIEAIRLFLAYASFMNFVGFDDPEFPDRGLGRKALYGLHQAPRAWYETLSTYLLENGFQRGTIDKTLFIKKVMQKEDGIFISQDKYVDEILKKFGFSTVKTTSTPMETSKPLLKDENAEDVDIFKSHLKFHFSCVKRIFRYLKGQPKLGLWYPKDLPFNLEAYSDSDYAATCLDRKSTTGGCQFLGSRLISLQCKKQTIVASSTTEAEYVAATNCCGQVLWIQNQMLDYGYNFMNTKIFIDNEKHICIVKNQPIPIVASSSQPKKTQKHRKTKVGMSYAQSSGPTTLVADETIHKERGDSVEKDTTTATSLNVEQGSGKINRTQSTAIPNVPFPHGIGSGGSTRLKKRVKKLESKKKSRTPQLKRRLFKVRIESSAEKKDLETQGRYSHDTGVNTASISITTASINITTVEPVTTASAPVTIAGVFVSTAEPSTPPITTTTTTPIEDEDLTIAKPL
ncbi:putative ribonuclease H-like domain-containing protein [Tanacetum coccineum]